MQRFNLLGYAVYGYALHRPSHMANLLVEVITKKITHGCHKRNIFDRYCLKDRLLQEGTVSGWTAY